MKRQQRRIQKVIHRINDIPTNREDEVYGRKFSSLPELARQAESEIATLMSIDERAAIDVRRLYLASLVHKLVYKRVSLSGQVTEMIRFSPDAIGFKLSSSRITVKNLTATVRDVKLTPKTALLELVVEDDTWIKRHDMVLLSASLSSITALERSPLHAYSPL